MVFLFVLITCILRIVILLVNIILPIIVIIVHIYSLFIMIISYYHRYPCIIFTTTTVQVWGVSVWLNYFKAFRKTPGIHTRFQYIIIGMRHYILSYSCDNPVFMHSYFAYFVLQDETMWGKVKVASTANCGSCEDVPKLILLYRC